MLMYSHLELEQALITESKDLCPDLARAYTRSHGAGTNNHFVLSHSLYSPQDLLLYTCHCQNTCYCITHLITQPTLDPK